VYWVDIIGETVFAYDPRTGENRVALAGRMVTALAETDRGGLLLITPTGLYNFESGSVTEILEISIPDSVRTNDGKCDPWGRVWFGTMDYETRRPIAKLMRYDGTLRVMAEGLILSNGLGWSPDGEVFYHVDSVPGVVYSYRHDPANGDIGDRKVLIDFSDTDETPDGLTVDADGNIWIAMWDGWSIRVFDPEGTPLHRLELDVQRPSCVVFGGVNLDDLYISTATEGLEATDLTLQPAAGELLMVRPGTHGLAGGVFEVR
jgi:sugar lactone lactonase YvrE